MSSDGLQAVDLLFGMLQPGEVFDNPHGLTPFNTGTAHGYFENQRGWSGTDLWAAASRALPAYMKPPAGKTASQNNPRLLSLINKTRDKFSENLGAKFSAGPLTKPLIETEGSAAEIFTDAGLEVTRASFLHAIEQLIKEGMGTEGEWLYSADDHALLYRLTAGAGGAKAGIYGLIKVC